MATTKKQEVEANVAIESVKEADKKVADIKAEQAAKRAARFAKRENWWGPFKYVGKFFNVCEEHPVATGVSVALGVPLGIGAVVAKDHFFGKKDEEATEEETPLLEEANEAPFDTEA